jgi:hypothetical protein
MEALRPIRLREIKKQARLLFKQSQKNASISERFRILSSFQHLSSDEIQSDIRLKHAYETIAIEWGFSNWRNLKKFVVEKDCLYRKNCAALVFSWFQSYEEASAYHQIHKGYLLSFWKDFVVCGKDYVQCIGLSPELPDWEKIGYDWVNPRDDKAFGRLKSFAIKNYLTLNK